MRDPLGEALTRLPEELRSRAQWCLAGKDKAPYLVGSTGLYNASPVKGPWMDFSMACKYANQYGLGMGFILTKDDPLACIDLDVKDVSSRDKNGSPVPLMKRTSKDELNVYSGLIQLFDSYAEMSASGKGIHIWVKGSIPQGRRKGGVEVYSDSRFIICTGNPISQVGWHILNGMVIPLMEACTNKPIEERQAALENIVVNFSLTQDKKFDLIELKQEFTDHEIWEQARSAQNNDKFVGLCEGRWESYEFPTQSEADLALLSMFTFYSKSNKQCRRMFRETALGQRDKAVKNDRYVDRTLKLIRSRQAREEVSVEQGEHMALKIMRQIQSKVQTVSKQRVTSVGPAQPDPLQPQQSPAQPDPTEPDPLRPQALRPQHGTAQQGPVIPIPTEVTDLVGQMTKQLAQEAQDHPANLELAETYHPPDVKGLDWPPGLVGAIAGFIYNSAPRPVKEVAIVAALGLMAGITGKAFLINGTGLNLYIVLVARSAVGKETMHSGIGLILSDPVSNSASYFVDHSDFVSGPALTKACETKNSFVNVAGELGRKLKRMGQEDSRDGPMQTLRTAITNLYSKSAPTSLSGGLKYSNKEQNVESVAGVAFSMIGETTPTTFYQALTSTMMEDGFLSRFLIIDYPGDRPDNNENPEKVVPPDIAKAIANVTGTALKMNETGQTYEVERDPEAAQMFYDFDKFCDHNIRVAGNDETQRQMWNRGHLKVMRISTILAVSDNHISPCVYPHHVTWAQHVVMADITRMKNRMASGDVGGDDETRYRKLMSVIHDHFSRNEFKSYKTNPAMKRNGIITRSYLQMRTCQLSLFTIYRNGATAALNDVLRTCMDNGNLQEMDRGKLINEYSFHGRAFRVVDLPQEYL